MNTKPKLSSFIQAAYLVIFLSIGAACKTTPKSSEVISTPVEVIIRLQNLLDADLDQKEYLYIIDQCGSVPSQGALLDNQQVKFTVRGIRPGDSCLIKIEHPGASLSELGFNSDDFLLYQASDVTIGRDIEGKYTANAFLLRQYYFRGNQRYTVILPVEVEKNIEAKKLNADITCRPQIYLSSESVDIDDQLKGVIVFNAVLKAESQGKRHHCTEINVFSEQKRILTGDLTSLSSPFIPSPGKLIDLSDSAVLLTLVEDEPDPNQDNDDQPNPGDDQNGEPDDDEEGDNSTAPKSCPEGQSWDAVTQSCIEDAEQSP